MTLSYDHYLEFQMSIPIPKDGQGGQGQAIPIPKDGQGGQGQGQGVSTGQQGHGVSTNDVAIDVVSEQFEIFVVC
jgi:hypothetical protein